MLGDIERERERVILPVYSGRAAGGGTGDRRSRDGGAAGSAGSAGQDATGGVRDDRNTASSEAGPRAGEATRVEGAAAVVVATGTVAAGAAAGGAGGSGRDGGGDGESTSTIASGVGLRGAGMTSMMSSSESSSGSGVWFLRRQSMASPSGRHFELTSTLPSLCSLVRCVAMYAWRATARERRAAVPFS
jgi:hypothetical protein